MTGLYNRLRIPGNGRATVRRATVPGNLPAQNRRKYGGLSL